MKTLRIFWKGAKAVWGLWAVFGFIFWAAATVILFVNFWPAGILGLLAFPVGISFATGKGWIDP